jgi:hypothetical protein
MGQKEKSTDKTRKVRVLNAAFQDIEDITNFIAIANQQPLNAIKVGEEFGKQLLRLNKTFLLSGNVSKYLLKQRYTAKLSVYLG